MARLYADEDFSYPVVERLREIGHDVLTAEESGQANRKTLYPPRLVASIGPPHSVY